MPKALQPPPKNLSEAKANFNKQLQQVGNYLIDSILSSGVYSRTMTNIMDKWSKGKASPQERKQVVQAAIQDFGALVGGGTAFHGSPHRFEKFSMEKIGTGEGAQTYGHGLYFAENPKTAEAYKFQTAETTFQGRPIRDVTKEFPDSAMQIAFKKQIPISEAADEFGKTYDLATVLGAVQDYGIDNAPRFLKKSEHKELLKTLVKSGELKRTGNMYQVDIPDEHIGKMLDYDKPLSEQAPEVQKKLSGILENLQAQSIKTREGFNAKLAAVGKPPMEFKAEAGGTGKDIYEAVVKWFETDDAAWEALGKTANKPGAGGASYTTVQQAASEYLAKLGIPGIKYLDQGSRMSPMVKINGKIINATTTQGPGGVENVAANAFWRFKGDKKAAIENLKSYGDTEAAKLLQTSKIEMSQEGLTRNFVVFDENIIKNLKTVE